MSIAGSAGEGHGARKACEQARASNSQKKGRSNLIYKKKRHRVQKMDVERWTEIFTFVS